MTLKMIDFKELFDNVKMKTWKGQQFSNCLFTILNINKNSIYRTPFFYRFDHCARIVVSS